VWNCKIFIKEKEKKKNNIVDWVILSLSSSHFKLYFMLFFFYFLSSILYIAYTFYALRRDRAWNDSRIIATEMMMFVRWWLAVWTKVNEVDVGHFIHFTFHSGFWSLRKTLSWSLLCVQFYNSLNIFFGLRNSLELHSHACERDEFMNSNFIFFYSFNKLVLPLFYEWIFNLT
jgi:hypothetical protein